MNYDSPNPLPSDLTLGPVRFAVGDLGRSIAFYDEVVGLRLHEREDGRAVLGDGEQELLHLDLEPEAAHPPAGAGMHHFALNFDERAELGRVAQRIVATESVIDRAADHGTHEALYIPDPDGHIIELACDRPRSEWQQLQVPNCFTVASEPFDYQSVIDALDGDYAAYADGVWVGHVHLLVSDKDRGLAFYRDVVGFDVMGDIEPAYFLGAGGYHHQSAVNDMMGAVPPLSNATVGLREWSMRMGAEDAAALRERLERVDTRIESLDDDGAGGFTFYDDWAIPLTIAVR